MDLFVPEPKGQLTGSRQILGPATIAPECASGNRSARRVLANRTAEYSGQVTSPKAKFARKEKGLPINTVDRKAFRIIQVASAGQRLLPGVIM